MYLSVSQYDQLIHSISTGGQEPKQMRYYFMKNTNLLE